MADHTARVLIMNPIEVELWRLLGESATPLSAQQLCDTFNARSKSSARVTLEQVQTAMAVLHRVGKIARKKEILRDATTTRVVTFYISHLRPPARPTTTLERFVEGVSKLAKYGNHGW